MARLNLPICTCGALQRDHSGSSGPCEASLTISAHGDCRCTKFKRASGRGNKFNAQRVAGFDSQAEHEQFNELVLMQRGGYIKDLRHHVTFEVQPEGCERIAWKVDFTFVDCATGKLVALEHKGAESEAYIIKRKLFRARYAGEIELRITAKVRGRIVADPRDRRAA